MEKEILRECPKCKKQYNAYSKWGIKKFCSRSCGNSRGPRTEDFKKKVSAALTGRIGHSLGKLTATRENRSCVECGKKFIVKSASSKKYCSKTCRRKNSGGYRPGSGRSKAGYYKQIYCGSTYELCWVIYNLDHNVKFNRFPGYLEQNGTKYYPDFLLDDGKTIVEIKGFEKQDSVAKKTKLAESFGYTVKVMRKDELQYAFNYVKETYGTSNYYTLYDEYKPKYEYVCSHCNTKFSRDKKLKTDVVFCSRVCAGKGHKGRNKKDAPLDF